MSSLLVMMSIFALVFSALFVILPKYIDGWKVVSGQVLIHLTPAAQELLFDPPAPMGPMHETKVIVLRSLAYNTATALVLLLLIIWLASRLPQYMRRRIHGNDPHGLTDYEDRVFGTARSLVNQPAGSFVALRIRTAFAGGLTGAIVAGLGQSLLLRMLDGVPQAAAIGCVVGAISGVGMAKRGVEPACIAAGFLTLVVGAMGMILMSEV